MTPRTTSNPEKLWLIALELICALIAAVYCALPVYESAALRALYQHVELAGLANCVLALLWLLMPLVHLLSRRLLGLPPLLQPYHAPFIFVGAGVALLTGGASVAVFLILLELVAICFHLRGATVQK